MTDAENRKTCFVIAPISARGTQIRVRSNQVFDHIIRPVVSKRGYELTRADKIPDPGMITHQIIERLLEDDLVVADLTGHNANVFYELAIRHAIRRPVVIMIAEGEDIPFDVSQSRAIQFDYRDLDSVAECKAELETQISSLEENPDTVFSPVSTAIDLKTMRESGDPSAQRDAHILSLIQSLQADFNRLERRVDNSVRGRVGWENDAHRAIERVIAFERSEAAEANLKAARRKHEDSVDQARASFEEARAELESARERHEAAIQARIEEDQDYRNRHPDVE